MVARLFRCDRSRLRLLLEDRLEEEEQAALARHLEACDSCRLGLELMAAESRWWGDARLLAGEASPPPPTDSDPCEAETEADRDSLGFLEPPAEPGQLGKLGPYEVIEIIGRGGMGVVLKAFDRPLGRFVAIKVLAPELATSATARRRFAREAQAAAAITHDHIVAIHAVDETPGGLPYLVMQHVSGRSLQDRLDRTGPLELRAVLRIGMQAASGLASAHAVGLVHRDVKPANILLENCVERVKLTDFGLARAADDASLTQSGVVAGTPQYMAPEQARGEPVDARADLFSLGSVLYALCTGRPPFRAETTMGVLRRVCEDTPRPIREVNPDVPDWLEAIVARLQAKDPAGRFGSAAEVADLLGRCLAYLEQPDGPPPFLPERAPTPRRKIRAGIVAAALLVVAITGLGASARTEIAAVADYMAVVLRIKIAEGTLVIQVDDPEVKVRVDGEDVVITGAGPQEICLNVRAGQHRVEKRKGDVVVQEIVTISRGGKQMVKATLEDEPGTSLTAAPGTVRETPRGQTRRYSFLADGTVRAELRWNAEELTVRTNENNCIKCHRESTRVHPEEVSARATTNEVTANISVRVHNSDVWCAVFSPDDKLLVAGTTDGVVKVIDIAARRSHALDGHSGTSACAAFSPDGRRFATSGDRTIKVWDTSSLRLLAVLDGHTEGVRSLAFSPDGKTLASGGEDMAVKLWEVDTWKERPAFPAQPQPVYSVCFSPDGKTLALGLGDWHVQVPGEIKLYDLATMHERISLRGHTHHVYNVAFSPDGKMLASNGGERTVKLWNPAYGCALATINAGEMPRGLAFTPDGRLLAAGIDDGSIALWDVASRRLWATLRGHSGMVHTVAISSDGKTLASAGQDGTVKLWELPDPSLTRAKKEVESLEAKLSQRPPTTTPSEQPKKPSLFKQKKSPVSTYPKREPVGEKKAEPEKLGDVEPTHNLQDPKILGRIESLEATLQARSPDGSLDEQVKAAQVKAARARFDSLRAEDARREIDPARVTQAALEYVDVLEAALLARRSQPAASGGSGPTTSTIAPSQLIAKRIGPLVTPNIVQAVAVAPDGKTLAAGCYDGTIRLWDPTTGEPKGVLKGQTAEVHSVAFSPDGRTLASAGGSFERREEPGEARLWDVASARLRHELVGHTGMVWSVAFSPDGTRVATGSWDKTARLWDVATGESRAVLSGHKGAIRCVAFSPRPSSADATAPDGKDTTVATASLDGDVRFWHHAPGQAHDGLLRSAIPISDVGLSFIVFSPDGRTLAISPWSTFLTDRPDEVILLDMSSGLVRARLRGHRQSVLCLTFSPDGATLASGGGMKNGPGDLFLWDVATGRAKAWSTGPLDWVKATSFTPDGLTLISGGGVGNARGEVRFWDVAGARAQSGMSPHPKR